MEDRDWPKEAARLKLMRAAHGLLVEDAAKIAGVTPRTWRKWESGGRGPVQSLPLVRFCVALEINMDWLGFGETYEETIERCSETMERVAPGWQKRHHDERVSRFMARVEQSLSLRTSKRKRSKHAPDLRVVN